MLSMNSNSILALALKEDVVVELISRLEFFQFYESNDRISAGYSIANSEIIATDTINLIINNVFQELYDRALKTKERPHEIMLTVDLMERTLLQDFVGYDTIENVFPEDSESMPSVVDNFARSHIPSKTHRPFLEESFSKIISESPTTLRSSSVFRLTEEKGRERAKKHIIEINKEQIPAPIDLKELAEASSALEGDLRSAGNMRYTFLLLDQLREAKERNINRLMAEEAQRKQLEEVAKEEKYKLAKLNADINKKNYTFDYDGKIILLNGPKADKLPPSSYNVNFAINNKTSEDQLARFTGNKQNKEADISKSSAKDLSRILKMKKAPAEEKEFTKMIVGPPAIFEELRPTMGVKIIEGGRKKEGARYTLSTSNLPNASTLSLGGNNSFRLSKDEKLRRDDYFQMVKGGNLSRQGYSAPRENEKVVPSELKLTDSLDYSKLSVLKGSITEKGKPKVAKMFNPMEVTPSTVRVHTNRLSQLMSSKEGTESDMFMTGASKMSNMNQSVKIDNGLQTNRVDSFNMNIMTSKDWGRNVSVGIPTYTPSSLPKGPRGALETALGMKNKYPRDRLARFISGSGIMSGTPQSITRDTYAPFSP